jgi:CheY-like chemotaxis protein
MQRALKSAGIRNPLHIVEDGQAAIDYLSDPQCKQISLPAIIFLDLKLPRKSGHDVLQWARAHPHLSNVAIVVLTSSNEPSDLRTSYRLGANSYLVKPPSPNEILDLAKAFNWRWLR